MSSVLVTNAPARYGPGTLRRVRRLTLVWLGTTFWASLVMPGIGVLREPRPALLVTGALGTLAVTVALGGVLYAAVTPDLPDRVHRRWALAFLATSAASLALVAPVAAGRWPTWAWLAAGIVGVLPLVLRPLWAALAAVACTAASVAVAALTGGSVRDAVLVTALVGAGIAAVNWAPAWLWTLLAQAEAGREAQAKLAASEERLRLAGDVHDLLGHNLTVIALKAELTARLTGRDPDAARAEAGHIQQIAGTALDQMREIVHGYHRADLPEELGNARAVLRSAGIACTVHGDPAAVRERAAPLLAQVLREAVTNVLRHSRATRCAITLTATTLTVENDGVTASTADPRSAGLQGQAHRLAELDGRMTIDRDGDRFTLRATVP